VTSADRFVVLPAYDPTYFAGVGTLTVDGAPTTVDLPDNRYTVLTFDGTRGQRLSIGLTGAADPGNVYLELADPYGAAFARDEHDSGRWGDGLYGAYDLPALPITGTYSLVVFPVADNLGTATITLSNKTVAPLAIGGAGTAVTLDRAGQVAELTMS
jgi:hypothetical protein